MAALPAPCVQHGPGCWSSHAGLAARYAELVDDEELRHRVFGKIDEHERTIRMQYVITGQDDLLADNPALARSVFNRFRCTSSRSNHLQVELLRRCSVRRHRRASKVATRRR